MKEESFYTPIDESTAIFVLPVLPIVPPLVALSRKNLFDAQDERRKQAAAADKAREVAVEEAVARIQRQMEESMSEAYRCDAASVFDTRRFSWNAVQ